MPTIKRKVEMNLGELLCWAIDNEEQARFRDFSSKSMRVRFNDNAKPEIIFAKQFLPIEQTFKVQVEEEITEDTVLPKILEIANDGYSGYATLHERTAINEVVRKSSIAFYFLNEDLSLTLIWTKEKGLIEND